MVDFDIRRAQLVECPTNDSRDWFLLNSKVCGVPLARFMATSPLVANFPGEFRTVSLDGAQLDRGVYKDVNLFLLPLHSVLSPPFCPKPDEDMKTRTAGWLTRLIA